MGRSEKEGTRKKGKEVEKKRQESRGQEAGEWNGGARGRGEGESSAREGYIRNLILISPQFNYSADKSCTCTA